MEPEQDEQGQGRERAGGSAVGSFLKKRITIAVLSVIISAVIAIGAFFMFLPLKLEHMMKNFAQKFGSRTVQVIEKRSDRVFEYYLSKVVVRKLRGVSACRTGLCDPNINTGNPMADVIRNWQADKFEDKLAKNQGIKFVLNKDTNKVQILRHRQNIGQFDADDGFKFDRDLKNAQVRSIMKQAVKNETKWHQIYQRRHMRDLLRTKYGVTKWRVFEKSRESAGDRFYLAKRRLRQNLIDNVSKPALARTPLYFRCLIDGCSASALDSDVDPHGIDERNRAAAFADSNGTCDRTSTAARCTGRELDGNDPNAQAGQDSQAQNEARDQIRNSDGGGADDETGLEEDDSTNSDREIKEVIQKTLTKKILASLGTGLGIAEIISQINRAIEDDVVGDIVENRNKLQYVRVYTQYRIMIDQFKEGTIQAEDVSAMMTQIDGLESSKLYAKDFNQPYRNNVAFNNTAHAAEDKPECDDGSNIAADEVICQDKKVRPSGRYSEVYKNSPMFIGIRAFAAAYDATVGKLFKWVIDAVGVIAGPIVSAIMELPGIKQIFGAAANLIEKIFNHFFGINITGAEERGEAYNGMRIGSDVMYNDTCRFSLGCTQVSATRAAAIDKQIASENSSGQNFIAKLLDTENSNSVSSRFISILPIGPRSFANQATLAFSNPIGMLNMQNIFSSPTSAATNGTRDKVGVVQMAYDLDNPQHKKYLELPIDDPFWDNCKQFNEDWTEQIKKDPDSTPRVRAYDGTIVVGINPCRANFVSAESLKSTSTEKDDGGIGGSEEECGNTSSSSNAFLVGDSISASDSTKSEITKALKAKGINEVTIDSAGSRSFTSGGVSRYDALEAIDQNTEAIKASGVVIIAIGTNGSGSAAQYEDQAKQAIGKIKSLNSGAKIYMVKIFTTTPRITHKNSYNNVIDRLSQSEGITIIDHNGKGVAMSDGVHPTPEGAVKYAAVLASGVAVPAAGTPAASGGDACTQGGEGELVSGSDKELACEIKNNSKIKLIGTNSQADINAACAGSVGPSGVKISTPILQVLATMGKNHSFNISSLVRPGDSDSAHSTGEAIDITGLDGNPIAQGGLGRTPNDIKLMKEISPLLPKPSGWGQIQCGPSVQLPRGIDQFNDTCHHLHLEVNN